MRLQEIMRHPVKTVGRGATLEAARELMRLEGVRHLVVVEGKAVVGILSVGDVGGPRMTAGVSEGIVEQVMAVSPVTATPHTTVREAANLLRGKRIGCLPILDDAGRLAGIVTETDLLELIGRGAESPSPWRKRAILARRGPKRRKNFAK